MTVDADKKLKTGSTGRTLGVRTDEIPVDDNGRILPETGGMSVSPNWRALAPWRIPKRLSSKSPGACGKNADECWRHGSGAFEIGPVNAQLFLRPNDTSHGLVEPAHEMSIAEYRSALELTRDDWVIDED